MNIAWKAGRYEEGFSFVPRYGLNVLELVPQGKGGLAVDLGSGTGALTEALAEKGYRVIGIDDSEAMIDKARELHPSVRFIKGNALDFTLSEKADVIFSNAVFHWIDGDKQDTLAENISRNLRSGGELVAEFGGRGCAEKVHSTLERLFAERGLDYPRVFYFPSIGDYAPVLERHGLKVVYATLFDRPTPQRPGNSVKDWVNMFVTKPFDGMDESLKEEILEECDDSLRPFLQGGDGTWIIDYVRIRVRAVKL